MAPAERYVFAEMLRISEPFPAGRVKTLPYSKTKRVRILFYKSSPKGIP